MALRFIESFDHMATADLNAKWTTFNNNGSAGIVASGRFGSRFKETHTFDYLLKTLDSQATWIVGFAFNTNNVTSANLYAICTLLDAGTTHITLSLDTSGHLVVRRGTIGSGTILGTGASVLSLDTWYYIELKVTINDTTGVVGLKLNGATELNLTSQDTRNGGNSTADQVQFGGGGQNNNFATMYWDDLYICDGSGSAPTNDFLGDVRVEAILPSGDGNSSQLVGSDGNSVNNSLLVDEATPNGDTDYVESSTVGNKDTYAFGNVTPTSGTVYGVQVSPYAKKTDAGSRSIVSIARLSATEVDSAVKTLTSSYLYLPDIREAKPGGGTWSITDVNNAEFGVKVNA